jgi:hypothetical protein
MTNKIQPSQLAEGSYTVGDNALKQIIGQIPSVGDQFYFDPTVFQAISSENANQLLQLDIAPPGGAVTSATINVTNAVPVLYSGFVYPTEMTFMAGFRAGVAAAKLWVCVNSTAATTQLLTNTMRYIESSGTMTVTGTGTSRIFTSTVASTFIADDYNADLTLTSYVHTPTGNYPITHFTDDKNVVATVPAGYSNESTVAFAVIRFMYQMTTGNITNTTVQEITCFSTPCIEYSKASANWNWGTNRIAIFIFGETTSASNIAITFDYNGPTTYSYMDMPRLFRVKNSNSNCTYNGSGDNYPAYVTNSGGTGSFTTGLHIPVEAVSILDANVVLFVETGATGSGKNIDLSVQYGTGFGTNIGQYTGTDTTSTYTFTSVKTFYSLPLLSLMPSAVGGSDGSVAITCTSVGGYVYIVQILVTYSV